MTICQALLWAKKILNKNIEGENIYSRLQDFGFGIDAEILLSYVLKKSRSWLFVNDKWQIINDKFLKFQTLINRRARGVPVAYLTNKKEFYGLDFYVDKRVLIPRPETEMLVDYTIHEARNMMQTTRNTKHITIADIGTGSGCIAIALAKNLMPNASSLVPHDSSLIPQIYATDISKDALTVARKNARLHQGFGGQANIKFLLGDLLEPLSKKGIKPDIIVANLPYLKPSQIKSDIQYEPRKALDGGSDGLKYYERLLRQIKENLLFEPGAHQSLADINYYLLFEIDPSQVKKITELIHKYLPSSHIEIKKDLAGRERVVAVTRHES